MSQPLPDNKWTDQRVALLRKGTADGRSCGWIARDINETTGSSFSRNSVIGKATRMNLMRTKTTTAMPRKNKAQRPSMPKLKSPLRARLDDGSLQPDLRSLQEVEAQPAPQEFRGLTLVQLEPWHCRYPRGGDGAPVLFCGQPKMIDSSYCPQCHARCCGGRTFRTPPWLKHWGPRS